MPFLQEQKTVIYKDVVYAVFASLHGCKLLKQCICTGRTVVEQRTEQLPTWT
jgi:hypothetical protein